MRNLRKKFLKIFVYFSCRKNDAIIVNFHGKVMDMKWIYSTTERKKNGELPKVDGVKEAEIIYFPKNKIQK